MGTTADKLAKLEETKEAIKTAINEPSIGDKFSDYPVAITEGKAYIAQKITAKGVQTNSNATFRQMGDNVDAIQISYGSSSLPILVNTFYDKKTVGYIYVFDEINGRKDASIIFTGQSYTVKKGSTGDAVIEQGKLIYLVSNFKALSDISIVAGGGGGN